jgi:hypothetical protein
MTEQPDPTQGRPLTNEQAARLDFAARDLETAQAADLGELPPAKLILTVERLRSRLDDVIQLIDEITQASPQLPE